MKRRASLVASPIGARLLGAPAVGTAAPGGIGAAPLGTGAAPGSTAAAPGSIGAAPGVDQGNF